MSGDQMATTTDATPGEELEPQTNLVTLTIDGFEVSVPEGTLLIRAAELIGIQIPRFCDHPLLEPVGACRQCLVAVVDAGNGRGRSEEHTYELQSLMRTSYAVFCLKTKKK